MRKISLTWFYYGLLMVVAACTSPIKERIPGVPVMHYPFSMALKGHSLLVSSQCSDHKYSFGRLVAIDTNAVESALAKAKEKGPLPYADVVTANTLIARDAGLLGIDGHVVFASRESQGLYAVLRDGNGFHCADPMKKLSDCAKASFLELKGEDPYSITFIADEAQNEKILATYLASERLDIVNLDKTKKGNALSLAKTFLASDLIREKLGENAVKGFRFVTRRAVVTNVNDANTAKVYLLLEKYESKTSELYHSKGAFLVGVLVKELLSSEKLAEAAIELRNLSDLYNITGALDFYIDDNETAALVLAREPESLFRLDLNNGLRFLNQPVCQGSSMIAVLKSHDRVFLPCYGDNKVISLKMSSLRLEGVSAYHGRGPAFVTVDEDHKKIFVSYNNDGRVVVLDFDLAYLGHIFNEAPSDRTGS